MMDLMMPEIDGMETICTLTSSQPELRILVLSSVDDEKKILEAVQMGALGYITKNTQRKELLRAIRTVHAGESYLPLQIAAKLISSVRETRPGKGGLPRSITPRQKEVLAMLGKGRSNQQIAKDLYITEATVRVHISHMMNILGFKQRRELLVSAAKREMKS